MKTDPQRGRDRGNESESAGQEKGSDASITSGERGTFPIVGIGASAGGLESIIALLKALSPDLGMAYVLVTHLDPHRESAFTEILGRVTTMAVMEIVDRIPIQPDHVYVIPPNSQLVVDHASLYLLPRDPNGSVSLTVDTFFRSLASDQGTNAIGIVLSGTGADGTLGIGAIKAEGGITFAQDSASAKYDGMPMSAISSGHVDFILAPEAIAAELARFRNHGHLPLDEKEVVTTSQDAQMAEVFQLLRRVTKVDFSEYKQPTILRRMHRRMTVQKVHDLRDYIALLQTHRQELTALYQDLLINVTSFFRNSEAFEGLGQIVYPAILDAREDDSPPIRIWVPGCSTGEEAYSHAITLVEFLAERKIEVPVQIFGTDLSEIAIAKARAGIYPENIAADVSVERLNRFFLRHEAGYQISKTIRDLCIFSTQNVFSDPPFSRMDVVSCRNVMIYLGHALQKRVIPIFHYALNLHGFLMIGNTEGLLTAGSDLFELADKKQKIYRKKLVPTPITFGFAVAPRDHGLEERERIMPDSKAPEPLKAPADLQREADRLLLTRYAPPSVIVNSQMEIVQIKGHTGKFLELPSGKASLNILKMARAGLLVDLQKTVEETRKTGVEANRRDVRIGEDGDATSVTLRVIPVRTPVHDQENLLIVFESEAGYPPRDLSSQSSSAPLNDDERRQKDQLIAQLKQELAATKEYLQAIIESQEATNEELQSANEEIQSGNEELQSTNEELQTSKEELESANEELHTVNEEMQHRNELLSQLNNDLTNLLNSVNLPLVMVGSDLSVRRFTPQAATVLGLDASDIGRPIPRLKLKIEVDNLEKHLLEVLKSVQPKKYRVKDSDGNWYSFRLAPYRTLDNRIDGVVLSIVNLQQKDEQGD
jgi:two-component system CheB/CheR fusion protein